MLDLDLESCLELSKKRMEKKLSSENKATKSTSYLLGKALIREMHSFIFISERENSVGSETATLLLTLISTFLDFRLKRIWSPKCSTIGVNIFIQFSFNGVYLLAGTGILLVSSFSVCNKARTHSGGDRRLARRDLKPERILRLDVQPHPAALRSPPGAARPRAAGRSASSPAAPPPCPCCWHLRPVASSPAGSPCAWREWSHPPSRGSAFPSQPCSNRVSTTSRTRA